MELWDIYDKDRRKTGRTHRRGAPLEPGERHLIVGVILLNRQNQVLCTLRSLKKEKFPGMWECTQGGVLAGENSRTAALREVREETGVCLDPDGVSLLYQDTVPLWFLDVYAARTDVPLSRLVFQDGETEDAAWIALDEWEARMRANDIVFPIDHGNEAFYRAVRQFAGLRERVVRYPLDNRSESLRKEILELQDMAWPDASKDTGWPNPAYHAVSFCAFRAGRLAAHAAVQKSRFTHRGHTYLACGLCEVVTHPDFRGAGLALDLIRRAAVFMEEQGADLSVFTCAPSLVPFYQKGGWEERPDLCFVGGSRERPFRSDSEGLSVMFRAFSERAKARSSEFKNTDIVIELGPGRLW